MITDFYGEQFKVEKEEKEEKLEKVEDPAELQASKALQIAKEQIEAFQYEDGINICLDLLKKDFEAGNVHELLMETLHGLGSTHRLVKEARKQLKEIVIENYSQ